VFVSYTEVDFSESYLLCYGRNRFPILIGLAASASLDPRAEIAQGRDQRGMPGGAGQATP